MANGSVLTPTPLRSNSMGKTINNTSKSSLNNNNNNNIRSNNHDETDTPSGVNGLSDKGNLSSKKNWFRPVPKMCAKWLTFVKVLYISKKLQDKWFICWSIQY